MNVVFEDGEWIVSASVAADADSQEEIAIVGEENVPLSYNSDHCFSHILMGALTVLFVTYTFVRHYSLSLGNSREISKDTAGPSENYSSVNK